MKGFPLLNLQFARTYKGFQAKTHHIRMVRHVVIMPLAIPTYSESLLGTLEPICFGTFLLHMAILERFRPYTALFQFIWYSNLGIRPDRWQRLAHFLDK